MKKNVNLVSSRPVVNLTYPDNGKIVACRVDNFPADNPSYLKRDGFRMSDVALLDRLSFGLNFDEDLARVVAGRVKEVSQSDKSNMSEKDMLATLRPAYVQTASEIKEFDERVYQYISTTMDVEPDKVAEIVDSSHSSDVVDSGASVDGFKSE